MGATLRPLGRPDIRLMTLLVVAGIALVAGAAACYHRLAKTEEGMWLRHGNFVPTILLDIVHDESGQNLSIGMKQLPDDVDGKMFSEHPRQDVSVVLTDAQFLPLLTATATLRENGNFLVDWDSKIKANLQLGHGDWVLEKIHSQTPYRTNPVEVSRQTGQLWAISPGHQIFELRNNSAAP